MSKVSSRQQAILEFIRNEVRAKGYPPSVREIGEAVGLASSSTVHGHLDRLEKKGFIRRDPTKPRAIELLGQEESENYNLFAHSVTAFLLLGRSPQACRSQRQRILKIIFRCQSTMQLMVTSLCFPWLATA